MKNYLQAFWLLIIAYTISMTYQFYRFQLNQYPEFDTFGTKEIIGYSVFFCWSALSLINRKWAMWSVVGLCGFQLIIGFFYYIPIIFVERHDTFWDWAECIGFIFLIALAGNRALRQLGKYKKDIHKLYIT